LRISKWIISLRAGQRYFPCLASSLESQIYGPVYDLDSRNRSNRRTARLRRPVVPAVLRGNRPAAASPARSRPPDPNCFHMPEPICRRSPSLSRSPTGSPSARRISATRRSPSPGLDCASFASVATSQKISCAVRRLLAPPALFFMARSARCASASEILGFQSRASCGSSEWRIRLRAKRDRCSRRPRARGFFARAEIVRSRFAAPRSGTHEASRYRIDPASPQVRSAQQPEQHGLGLIVHGVAQRHAMAARRRSTGGRISCGHCAQPAPDCL